MNCRVCQNEKDNIAYQVKEMYWGTADEFTYFECSQCGCLQIMDVPENMGKYYDNRYYSFTNNPETSSNNIPFIPRLKRWFRIMRASQAYWQKGLVGWFFVKIKRNHFFPLSPYGLHLNKDSKVLDVGCGSGELLCRLKEHGMKNLYGIDPYVEKEIRYKNGVVIYKMSLEDSASIIGKMDLIMFNHSFEHMLESVKVLSFCRQILQDGGRVLIRVPTTSSEAWRIYRENWAGIMAPFHFILHSRKSLTMVAVQAGFQVETTMNESNEFQFWASEQIRLGIPVMAKNSYEVNRLKSIFTKAQIAEYRKRSKALNETNEGDWIAVVLK